MIINSFLYDEQSNTNRRVISFDLIKMSESLDSDYYKELIIHHDDNIHRIIEYYLIEALNLNMDPDYIKYKISNDNFIDTVLINNDIDLEFCITKDLFFYFDCLEKFIGGDYSFIYTCNTYINDNNYIVFITKNIDFRIYEWKLNKFRKLNESSDDTCD